MRERKTAFLWTLTILAALAMLLPLTARAELIFPDRYCYTNYIRYTADSPLTITLDSPPTSSTGCRLIYEWGWGDYDGGDTDFTLIERTTVPSLTLTPAASDHNRLLSLNIFEEGKEDEGYYGQEFYLRDSSIPMPVVPQESGFYEYDLFLGDSITLKVPAATADVSGKTLVYEWFRELPGGGDELAQRSGSPTLTVTNDGKQDWWYGYFCRVFYEDDENSEIWYNSYFTVNFYSYGSDEYKVDGEAYRSVARDEIAEVPADIGTALNNPDMTVAELKVYVFDNLNKSTNRELKQEMAQLYDVKLQTKDENGNWAPVTKDTFPRDGLLVLLPYPEGTDQWNYDFSVAHIFEETSAWGRPGQIEYPYVEKTAEGLKVRLKGLSPVMIAWEKAESLPTAADVPKTGDSMPLGFIAALLAASACVMVALGWKNRKKA